MHNLMIRGVTGSEKRLLMLLTIDFAVAPCHDRVSLAKCGNTLFLQKISCKEIMRFSTEKVFAIIYYTNLPQIMKFVRVSNLCVYLIHAYIFVRIIRACTN